MLRSDPRRRIFLDLDPRLLLVLVFGILRAWGKARDVAAVGKWKPPETVRDVIGRHGLRDLEGAPDPRHALVGAVGDNGIREGLVEQSGVWRLPCAQKLCEKRVVVGPKPGSELG